MVKATLTALPEDGKRPTGKNRLARRSVVDRRVKNAACSNFLLDYILSVNISIRLYIACEHLLLSLAQLTARSMGLPDGLRSSLQGLLGERGEILAAAAAVDGSFLAIAQCSVDLFYKVFAFSRAFSYFHTIQGRLVQACCPSVTCPWLLLLLEFTENEATRQVLCDINTSFQQAVKIATGLSLQYKNRKTHVPNNALEPYLKARLVSMRLLSDLSQATEQPRVGPSLTAYVDFLVDKLDTQQAADSLFKSGSALNDPLCALYAARSAVSLSLAKEGCEQLVEAGNAERCLRTLANELQEFARLRSNLSSSLEGYNKVDERFVDANEAFQNLLFDMCGKDETSLDHPLLNFLQENELLNQRYIERNEVQQCLALLVDSRSTSTALFTANLLLVRYLILLNLRLLSCTFGAAVDSGAAAHPTSDGARIACLRALQQRIKSLDWPLLLSFSEMETSLFSCPLSPLLLALPAGLFEDVRDEVGLAPWASRALAELLLPHRQGGASLSGETSLRTRASTVACLAAEQALRGSDGWQALVEAVRLQLAHGPLALSAEDGPPEAGGVQATVQEFMARAESEYYKFHKDRQLFLYSHERPLVFAVCLGVEASFADPILSCSGMEGRGLPAGRRAHPLDVPLRLFRSVGAGPSREALAWAAPLPEMLLRAEAEGSEALLNRCLQGLALAIAGPSEPLHRFPPFYCSSSSANNVFCSEEIFQRCIELAARAAFQGRLHYLVGIGCSDTSTMEASLRLLSAAALVAPAAVSSALVALCTAADPQDDPLGALCEPFLLVLGGGSEALFEQRVLSGQWRAGEATEDFVHQLRAASAATRLAMLGLFAALTDAGCSDPRIGESLATYPTPLVTGLAALLSRSAPLAGLRECTETQLALRLATNLAARGRDAVGSILFLSPYNDLSNMFCHECDAFSYCCGAVGACVQALFASYLFNGGEAACPAAAFVARQEYSPASCALFDNKRHADACLFSWRCKLQDLLRVSLEWLVEVLRGRSELQAVISAHHSSLLQQLARLLQPRSAAPFDPSLAATVARLLAALAHRNAAGQRMITATGCAEGLMASLMESTSLDDAESAGLSRDIIAALERLIQNNLQCWKSIQRVGGTEGMLRMCRVGNATIRIISCSTMLQHCTTYCEEGEAYKARVLAAHGLHTLFALLDCGEALVQQHALSLILVLLQGRGAQGCSADSVAAWTRTMFALLRSPHTDIARLACDILEVLSLSEAAALRELTRLRCCQGEGVMASLDALIVSKSCATAAAQQAEDNLLSAGAARVSYLLRSPESAPLSRAEADLVSHYAS